ncbi:MAG: succinate dehydrogenase, cytochrome b556 subunit [Gammaproteobacteria bacterium]|nr:succinate dehydrogenase, cytochrome b556 subunit [Gammaproteobacteria bacterium]
MPSQRTAPVYLNLFRIRFPAGAITSIAHRLSGVFLFLSLPFLIHLLDLSLQGPAGFEQAIEWLQCGWIRAGSVVIAWSLMHHLLAGIRFLLIDIEAGVTLPTARTSAWFVNITAALLTLAWVGWIL